MSNEFVFHGVGQGLFYSGSLDNGAFRFIFDCGSETPKTIELPFFPCYNIGFVAISHFHKDHINGLPLLFQNYQIKKVYLPYFDVRKYKNVFVANLIAGGLTPQNIEFHWMLRWYGCQHNFQEPSSDFANAIGETEPVFVDSNDKSNFQQVWFFHFYNKRISNNKLNRLQGKLNALLGGKSIEEYVSCQKSIDQLQKCFMSIFRNLNVSSLVLLHWGIEKPEMKTLLTGDVLFDQDLTNRIKQGLGSEDRIVLQIPHHGAKKEWDKVDDWVIGRAKDMVLSFGLSNGYRHPCKEKVCASLIENEYHKLKFVVERYDYIYKI